MTKDSEIEPFEEYIDQLIAVGNQLYELLLVQEGREDIQQALTAWERLTNEEAVQDQTLELPTVQDAQGRLA